MKRELTGAANDFLRMLFLLIDFDLKPKWGWLVIKTEMKVDQKNKLSNLKSK